MSFNIVSLVMQHLGPEVVAKIARALGLESHLASRAIGALVPGMLGSLASGASTPVGAAHLAGVLDSIDPAGLGGMAANIGGANQATMIGSGNALLGLALGGPPSDALASAFSRFAGIDGLSANALTGIVGTGVLGSLASLKRSQGLDSSGLGTLLAGQAANIQAALPAGFNALPGVGGAAPSAVGGAIRPGGQPSHITTATSNAQAAVRAAAPLSEPYAAPVRSRALFWVLPLAALFVAGVWYLASATASSRRLVAEQQRVVADKAAADAKVKADAEARAKAEADAKAKAEADARARAEAEAKARAEAEARAQAEARAKAEAEAKARAEAEARQKAEADAAKARADADAAEKARQETEAKARTEAQARQLAEADAVAAKARAEAEAKARTDAEAAAKARAEADSAAAARVRAEAEAKQRADAEAAKARAEAEAKAKADAEARQRAEAEAKRKAEADAAAAAAAAAARTATPAPVAPAPVAAAPSAAPATVAVAKACEADIKQLIASGSIRFRIASATIQPDSAATLNKIAAAINGCQGTKVRVEGHTDADGDEQENLDLSNRRAKAVQDFLIKAGVPADRLSSVGLGQTKPLAPNDSAENKLKNRRTEVIVDPK